MDGAPGTLYEGEKFQLLFKFSGRYPFDSPQVNCESPYKWWCFCLVFFCLFVSKLNACC